MQILYKYFDGLINEEEALLSGDYDKVFVQSDGSNKIVESYRGNELTNVEYYLDPKESEEMALKRVVKYNCGFDVYTSEKYGQFLIENGKLYNHADTIRYCCVSFQIKRIIEGSSIFIHHYIVFE